MLTIGLEPITIKEQILSLSCLPISPSEQKKRAKKASKKSEQKKRAKREKLFDHCRYFFTIKSVKKVPSLIPLHLQLPLY